MRTVGIVVEYNPLHNGHVQHYQESVKAAGADACIAVMSGHFLQRGEPALLSKWARTEMALHMGADLVIELPAAYSCQPAEWFAYGAVKLLHATGVTDALSFGSEDGRIEPFLQLADKLYIEDDSFRSRLKEELKSGVSYPSAYARAACGCSPPDGSEAAQELPVRLDRPNNILGLHYLLALKRLESPIAPLTVARRETGYHDREPAADSSSMASATAIRSLLLDTASPDSFEDKLEKIAPYVPPYTLSIIRREHSLGRGPMHWERYAAPLFAQLLGRSAEELEALYEVTEGLEHRIKAALREMPADAWHPVEALVQRLKTKRYTYGKLQRTLLRILLQHPKHELTRQKLFAGPSCLRILGFSEQGQKLLKRMKTSASLPIVTRVTRETGALIGMDIRATSVYSLGYRRQSPEEWLRDYSEPPLKRHAQEDGDEEPSFGGSSSK